MAPEPPISTLELRLSDPLDVPFEIGQDANLVVGAAGAACALGTLAVLVARHRRLA